MSSIIYHSTCDFHQNLRKYSTLKSCLSQKNFIELYSLKESVRLSKHLLFNAIQSSESIILTYKRKLMSEFKILRRLGKCGYDNSLIQRKKA